MQSKIEQITANIKAGKTTAHEQVEQALKIAKEKESLHALLETFEDYALKRADEIDAKVKNGEKLSFYGGKTKEVDKVEKARLKGEDPTTLDKNLNNVYKKIKEIGYNARKELELMTGRKIFLELIVEVLTSIQEMKQQERRSF